MGGSYARILSYVIRSENMKKTKLIFDVKRSLGVLCVCVKRQLPLLIPQL